MIRSAVAIRIADCQLECWRRATVPVRQLPSSENNCGDSKTRLRPSSMLPLEPVLNLRATLDSSTFAFYSSSWFRGLDGLINKHNAAPFWPQGRKGSVETRSLVSHYPLTQHDLSGGKRLLHTCCTLRCKWGIWAQLRSC